MIQKWHSHEIRILPDGVIVEGFSQRYHKGIKSKLLKWIELKPGADIRFEQSNSDRRRALSLAIREKKRKELDIEDAMLAQAVGAVTITD